jgi:hypothetical protein
MSDTHCVTPQRAEGENEMNAKLAEVIESVIMERMAKQVTQDPELLENASNLVCDKMRAFETELDERIASVVSRRLGGGSSW